MALLFTLVLLGFILKNDDFSRFALLHDRTRNFNVFRFRARLDSVAVGNHQSFERNGVAFCAVQLFNAYYVAFRTLYCLLPFSMIAYIVFYLLFPVSKNPRRSIFFSFFAPKRAKNTKKIQNLKSPFLSAR